MNSKVFKELFDIYRLKNRLKKMIKVTKDLIIRSSSAEFLIFERQTHDKGIQVRFEDGFMVYSKSNR